MNDWKNIYGPVPESFQRRVRDTLSGLEEPQKSTRRRAAWRGGRALLIAAAAAVLLSATALAAGLDRLGFFDTLFGTGAVVTEQAEATPTPAPPEPETAADGTVTQQAYEYTMDDSMGSPITLIMPGYERIPADEALAEELIGPYIQELNKSFTLPNEDPDSAAAHRDESGTPTVTLLHYVQDEAGTGYLYFSVENANGLDLNIREDRGYTVTDGIFRGGQIMLHNSSPILVDTENTTDTKAYMGVPIADAENCAVEIVDYYGFVGGFDETYELKAERPAAAVTAEGRYVTVSVSPMGASIAEAGEWAELHLMDYIDGFTITMKDGSEYVVFHKDGASPVDNTTYKLGRMDGSVGCCFNRIIDPAQIASVTVTVISGGDGDSGYTFAEDEIAF